MTRNGFRVFDSDTHVGPYMDVLSSYLSEAENATLAHWEDSKRVDAHGRITYTRGQRHYRRRLGEDRGGDDARWIHGWFQRAKLSNACDDVTRCLVRPEVLESCGKNA
jgi:hypothetical protein